MAKDLTRLRSISTQIVFVICVVSVIVPLLVWVSDYRLPVTSDLVCYNDACNMSGPVHVTLDGIIASNSKAFDVAQWDHTRLDNGRNLYHFSDGICDQFPEGSSAQRVCHHHYGMSAFIITTLVLIIVAAVVSVASIGDGAFISRVVKRASDMTANIPCCDRKVLTLNVADATKSALKPGRALFQWLLIMLSAVFWETYLVGHTHGGVHDQRAAGPAVNARAGPAVNASGSVTWDGDTPVSQGFGYGCIYMLQYYLWAATAVSTVLFLVEGGVFGELPAEAVDVGGGSGGAALSSANKRVQMQGIELRNLELLRPSQVSVRNTRTAPTVRGSLLQQ